MPDVMDYNLSQPFVHGIYNAIIADTYPVKLLGARQLRGRTRKWILPQSLNLPQDSDDHRFWQEA
jgi:hypothetical protein